MIIEYKCVGDATWAARYKEYREIIDRNLITYECYRRIGERRYVYNCGIRHSELLDCINALTDITCGALDMQDYANIAGGMILRVEELVNRGFGFGSICAIEPTIPDRIVALHTPETCPYSAVNDIMQNRNARQ